jgi:hypothetical protein
MICNSFNQFCSSINYKTITCQYPVAIASKFSINIVHSLFFILTCMKQCHSRVQLKLSVIKFRRIFWARNWLLGLNTARWKDLHLLINNKICGTTGILTVWKCLIYEYISACTYFSIDVLFTYLFYFCIYLPIYLFTYYFCLLQTLGCVDWWMVTILFSVRKTFYQ